MILNKAENITLQFILVLTCLLFPKAIAECGGTLETSGEKTFQSLQNFDGNTKCTWILKVPSEQRIKAMFDFFSSVSTEPYFMSCLLLSFFLKKSKLCTKIPTLSACVSGTAAVKNGGHNRQWFYI